MFGQDHHAVYEMIERLHGSVCCYRELRAKYRGRDHRAAPPATASASLTVSPPAAPAPSTPPPPQSTPAAPVSPPVNPSAASPPPIASPSPAATVTRPEATPGAPVAPPPPASGVPGLDDSLIVGYRTVQGRMVPVYADPGELTGPAANGGTGTGAPNTAPSPSTDPSPPAVHAAPPRTQHTATTLSLDPPTPPPIVREVDQAAPIERVLAEHRTLLAEQARAADERHAAVLRDLLADHRQALAAADERHRELLAELLARHRAELREASARNDGDPGTIADLRELLAEQATASAEQNACLGDMIATLVETVSRIALSRATPRAPIFTPPPLRVVAAADDPKGTTGPKGATDPGTSSRDATAQPPGAAPPPAPTPGSSAASETPASPARVAVEPRPAPTTRPAPPPPSPSTTTPAAASPATQTTRDGYVTPRAPSLLALITELIPEAAPARSTPRELRAQQEARDRQRMYEAVDECADDDDFMAGTDDDSEVMESPNA